MPFIISIALTCLISFTTFSVELEHELKQVSDLALSKSEASENAFSLAQLNKLANRSEITLVLPDSQWQHYVSTILIPRFTQKTGVKVAVEVLSPTEIWQKQQQSLREHSSQYDLLVVNPEHIAAWSYNGELVPLAQAAKLARDQAFTQVLQNYSPRQQHIFSYNQQQYSLPFHNDVLVNIYQEKLFSNLAEQHLFEQRNGYPLSMPDNIEQLIILGEFFTRATGQKIAGKKLNQDFSAYRRPHSDEEYVYHFLTTLLSNENQQWLTPVFRQNKLTGYHLEDLQLSLEKSFSLLRQLKTYSVAEQENNDQEFAMEPFTYASSWLNYSSTQTKQFDVNPIISQQVTGKFYGFAISQASRNKVAAYWLWRFLNSFESQFAYGLLDGLPSRSDVLNHTYWLEHAPKQEKLFSALNISMHVPTAQASASIACPELLNYLSLQITNILSTQGLIKPAVSATVERIASIQNTTGQVPVVVTK